MWVVALPRVSREWAGVFWRARVAGALIAEAAEAAGVSERCARRWIVNSGGMIPEYVDLDGSVRSGERTRTRYLDLTERTVLAVSLEQGCTQAQIAARLGRSRSTISRELARNQTVRRRAGQSCRGARSAAQRVRYDAINAQSKAEWRARRPKPGVLEQRPRLAGQVTDRLKQRWSPRQIAATLRREFPDQPEMWVSHETIYKTLYVQARGGLRRELTAHLRTGRRLRKPHRIPGERRGKRDIPDNIKISARPAEAADRAVPGHWEGDLIMGRNNHSAIGTLVERTTRYVMLLHLPNGTHTAQAVRDAMRTTIPTLPQHLWRSLTWDQGTEMALHTDITLDTGLTIYFCDPHSPWQRGSNENTNGLLRQYFPKGTDLSPHTPEHLTAVAAELNGRPRQTLNWDTPAQRLHQLLSTPQQPDGVATTP